MALNRRDLLRAGVAFGVPAGVVTVVTGCQKADNSAPKEAEPNTGEPDNAADDTGDDEPKTGVDEPKPPVAGDPINVYYLEIVTPEVEALCGQYSKVHGVTFSEPIANFGNARTAKLVGGGMIGIRGPMRGTETPVVRPYMLVDDIKAAVESAAKSGGKVAMPPMEIPGHGQFAIVIHGGIECGFWQTGE